MLKILLTATVQSHICQFHRPLVEMLKANGDVEIHVAARNNLKEKNGLQLDFADKVFDIPFSRSPRSPDNIKAYKAVKKIIHEEKYDIIHCNTPMGGIVTRLAASSSRKKGTKVYYTAHGFHFYKGASIKNWLFFYPVEKLFSYKTDKLITINNEDYNLAKSRFKCKIEHIHGVGVNSQRYYPIPREDVSALKTKLGLDVDKRYIICVGELLPNKNHKMAIEAMADVVNKHPDAVLLIAGNGSEKDNLLALINERGLCNNVKLLGYVTNLEEYQRVCELSVACSYREGLGLNLIEAMLTANPVVATDNRGHRELVQDGKNGFLVAPDNVKLMSEKINCLLSSFNLACDMGEYGKNFCLRYSSEAVKEELRNIYFGEYNG